MPKQRRRNQQHRKINEINSVLMDVISGSMKKKMACSGSIWA